MAYQINIPSQKSNPTKASRERTSKLMQLRLSMLEVNPGMLCSSFPVQSMTFLLVMQARNFAFLDGFLPVFAKQQMVFDSQPLHITSNLSLFMQEASKTTSKARNILGFPNTSAFGTYAYCASSHTDNDESATSGWVMKRSSQVS